MIHLRPPHLLRMRNQKKMKTRNHTMSLNHKNQNHQNHYNQLYL